MLALPETVSSQTSTIRQPLDLAKASSSWRCRWVSCLLVETRMMMATGMGGAFVFMSATLPFCGQVINCFHEYSPLRETAGSAPTQLHQNSWRDCLSTD